MFERDPDFNQIKKLWTLKLVVEAGGLKPAATRSKVSVSAVSQSITGLERAFGRKLILRRDRKLFPTEFCREILASVEPAFQAFHSFGEIQACPVNTPNMAWLNFGASESVSAHVLPPLVIELRKKLPKLRLTLQVGRSGALTALVKRGELCMALVDEVPSMKGVSIFPIYQERLGLFMSARHDSPTTIATLAPETGGHPVYYARFLRALGAASKHNLVSDSHELLYSLACAGEAMAVLPLRLAMRARGLLKEVPLERAARDPKLGQYQVSMISETTCDPAEDEFLINELRSLV